MYILFFVMYSYEPVRKRDIVIIVRYDVIHVLSTSA
jgi:hypothetical protein